MLQCILFCLEIKIAKYSKVHSCCVLISNYYHPEDGVFCGKRVLPQIIGLVKYNKRTKDKVNFKEFYWYFFPSINTWKTAYENLWGKVITWVFSFLMEKN